MHENQFKNMATQKQIIAFINPDKFASLFGNETPQGYFENDTNLDNGYNLVYVLTNGKHEVAAYNEAKAKAASIVLVSDSFNFQYVPEVPFKVLWHGGTDEKARVQRLRDIINHFQGDDRSQEEENTPYKKIANLINKQQNATFESIYETIEEYDKTIEDQLGILATSLPFDNVHKGNSALENAKSELEKAVTKRLSK